MIDFVIVSCDLRPYVLDTRVKRGAELSTDHHFVVSWIRKLLIRTGDITGQWKEHFEEVAAKVVKKILGSKAPGVDEIRPEMLKAPGIVGLSWLTRLFNVAWGSGTVPLDWQTVVVVPICSSKTGAVPDLLANLVVGLRHLWSQTLGRDRKNKVANKRPK